MVPQWMLPGNSAAEPKTFLSLYGGESAVAKAFRRHGHNSLVLDIAHDEHNDLGRPRLANKIPEVLQHITHLGIDLPCQTWSRARRAPPGSSMPSALRGDTPDTIMGLPNLSAADQNKVRQANIQVSYALKYIRHCLRLGIPGYLENPLTSRLWKHKKILRLVQVGLCRFIDFHMCQFGTLWNKPTRLLVWCVDPDIEFPKCSKLNGVCDLTGKPHLMLSGLSNGKFLTAAAQVYPSKLGTAIYNLLLSHPQPP